MRRPLSVGVMTTIPIVTQDAFGKKRTLEDDQESEALPDSDGAGISIAVRIARS